MRVIGIYPQKLTISSNIKFDSSHPKYQSQVQQYFSKPRSQADVKLLGPLFDNDGLGNIIFADNPKIIKGYNNIVVILLVLFVP